jgi:hypothetical protein
VGIMSYNSSHGQILDNTVQNTLADSITQIVGSSSMTVSGNRTLNSGDDGISTVSYVGSPMVSLEAAAISLAADKLRSVFSSAPFGSGSTTDFHMLYLRTTAKLTQSKT